MKVSVVHHSLHVAGGGERVTLSLLKALDKTKHDIELRCVHPPPGVLFHGQAGERTTQQNEYAQLTHKFNRVRLTLIREGGTADGNAPDFGAEVRALFKDTKSDILVVTDGGFILGKTDAPRILLYCNSDLSAELQALHGRFPHSPLRSPLRALRACLAQAAFRKTMAGIRDGPVVAIPNTESTARSYSRLVGSDSLAKVIYPPVDLGRFKGMHAPKDNNVATTGRFSPEKNYRLAIAIMHRVGARWDAVGNARGPLQEDHLAELRAGGGGGDPDIHFHVNASEGELDMVLKKAKAYLHTRPESFGIAVVEAIAAGCVPIVPNNTGHTETVPFRQLRYETEDEAVDKVKGAIEGRYDCLLPALAKHAEKFSEQAFQAAMLAIIEGRGHE